jgi:hypothetical protein
MKSLPPFLSAWSRPDGRAEHFHRRDQNVPKYHCFVTFYVIFWFVSAFSNSQIASATFKGVCENLSYVSIFCWPAGLLICSFVTYVSCQRLIGGRWKHCTSNVQYNFNHAARFIRSPLFFLSVFRKEYHLYVVDREYASLVTYPATVKWDQVPLSFTLHFNTGSKFLSPASKWHTWDQKTLKTGNYIIIKFNKHLSPKLWLQSLSSSWACTFLNIFIKDLTPSRYYALLHPRNCTVINK